MRIICKKCGKDLSKNVAVVASTEVLSGSDGSDYVPEGFAYREDGKFWPSHAGSWCLNKGDVVNLAKTHNPRRLSGCCDLDGCDGPNMVCAICGKEVATAKLDCWMPQTIIFEGDNIYIAT